MKAQPIFDFIYGFLAIIYTSVFIMALLSKLGIALEVLVYSISAIFIYSVFRVLKHYTDRIAE